MRHGHEMDKGLHALGVHRRRHGDYFRQQRGIAVLCWPSNHFSEKAIKEPLHLDEFNSLEEKYRR